MSPYATPISGPRKSKPGAPLAETKRLVIDYRELNKQIPKVQTITAKSKGSLMLIETAKIDHIWSNLRGTNIFQSLTSALDFTIFPSTLTLDQKQLSHVPMENFNGKE